MSKRNALIKRGLFITDRARDEGDGRRRFAPARNERAPDAITSGIKRNKKRIRRFFYVFVLTVPEKENLPVASRDQSCKSSLIYTWVDRTFDLQLHGAIQTVNYQCALNDATVNK